MIPIIITAVLTVLDQITKYLAYTYLRPIKKIVLINGFFNLTYVENRGAAFGALQGARWFFVILAAAVLVFCAIYYAKMEKKRENLWLRTAMVLICSGTIGNVIDRVAHTYVIDFFDFIIIGYDFPVFNIADILIVCGAALLAFGVLFFEGKKGAEK